MRTSVSRLCPLTFLFFFLPLQQRKFLRLKADNHSRAKMIGGALVNARGFSAGLYKNPFIKFALVSMDVCRDNLGGDRPLAFPKTDTGLLNMQKIYEVSCEFREGKLFHRTLGVQLLLSDVKDANPAFNTSIDRLNNANPFHNHQLGQPVPNLFN
jgi:hypothetical protein